MSRVFRGVAASPGVAVGRALPWQPLAPPAPLRSPRPGETPADELLRFESARANARDEMRRLKSRLMSTLGESYAAILDAQTLLLDDPALVTEVEHRVRAEGVSASFAVHATIDAYLTRFDAIEDRYLRDRAGDLRDVQRRLVRLLEPAPDADAPPPDGPIVVVAQAVGHRTRWRWPGTAWWPWQRISAARRATPRFWRRRSASPPSSAWATWREAFGWARSSSWTATAARS